MKHEPTTRVWKRFCGKLTLYPPNEATLEFLNVAVDVDKSTVFFYEEGTDDMVGTFCGVWAFLYDHDEDLSKWKPRFSREITHAIRDRIQT